jgi:selenide,water dikinase
MNRPGAAQSVKLTALSPGAGCACKLPAAELAPLLEAVPQAADPDLLVGTSTADDAGVYRLRDDLAIVQSADFFTPIVDDPYDFGRIAATNALSDIYAMGGRPLVALNLVAWSVEELGSEALREVLRGGAEVAGAAGVAIIGGHTIVDREPKYGLAVTGVVHPDEVITNASARAGDVLVLTKPVGSGAVSTALKKGLADAEVVAAAVEVMTELNDQAARAARAAGAHAMTDVSGFGLLGHLRELALASGLAAELDADAVPAIAGALELLADDRALAGGSRKNREQAAGYATFDAAVDEIHRRLVCDAMTSGGLLVALAPQRARELSGRAIGRLLAGEAGRIAVRAGGR